MINKSKVMQSSTVSISILMSALSEYMYRFQTNVYHYADDTVVIKKSTSQTQ